MRVRINDVVPFPLLLRLCADLDIILLARRLFARIVVVIRYYFPWRIDGLIRE